MDRQPLSIRELDAQAVELLPQRETLLSINIVNIVAVNLAIALNVLTAGSSATAIAGQTISVLMK